MEAVTLKKIAAHNALNRLEEIIQLINDGHFIDTPDVSRDSLITRSNFTYDAFYKYLRSYLQENLGISIEEHASPRAIFRLCTQANVVQPEELTILLNMAEDRNKAAHMYNETMAQEAASHIPEYAKTIKAILSRL